MSAIAKMVVTNREEHWGANFPPIHFDEEHDWPPEKQGTCECEMIADGVGRVTVHLQPVYETEPGSENHAFWNATPSGSLNLDINNPAAAEYFETGVEYYVEIRKAQPSKAR